MDEIVCEFAHDVACIAWPVPGLITEGRAKARLMSSEEVLDNVQRSSERVDVSGGATSPGTIQLPYQRVIPLLSVRR